ncbi:hypothetical protein Calkr_1261 [Caldicellulosiruptor acetigenus I77R1B]|uniref:DUF4352 domain-containing protein n=1 Tax=Caldicellulosiruptor acetigenus (strain ATCC 700853 / DSM 12137 / I77R1B) TaxID=632335 RepID=E4S7M9_CALA7|nr:hypothetical protein [Caldicellulosiruptor acetigenus]ADQ40769.1 hypothetical protein Calkr_1261 [Caldicellulosiruptor acetigenus I77R1B]
MKRRLVCILFTLLAVYIILSIFIIKNSDKHIYVYHEPSNLSIRYGESQYSVIVQNIKVSLEKVTKEKFYITYSQVTGNQSYFGLTLIIENLEKKKINKAAFEYIYIEDTTTKQKYYPIPYFEIENFPQDQPLLYKAKFYAKFQPLPHNTITINIYFKFASRLFILQNVDIR